MSSFVCRQPNGLLCRFSHILDCPTHYNMTDEDYIEMVVKEARRRAEFDMSTKNSLPPFYRVEEYFLNTNMKSGEFKKILKEMKSPVTEKTKTNIVV